MGMSPSPGTGRNHDAATGGIALRFIAALQPVMTNTSRLDELEMRVAHQDQTIEDLNAAITAQWKLIERLKRQVLALRERVAESEQGAGEAVDRPPPHY